MNVNSHHQAVGLLVEDEPLVRMLAAKVLAEAGFRVVEAANADEALTLLQARPDVLVVVSDVEMPGKMNGFALARAERERASGVGVILTSGRVAPQPGDMPANCLFLAMKSACKDRARLKYEKPNQHSSARTSVRFALPGRPCKRLRRPAELQAPTAVNRAGGGAHTLGLGPGQGRPLGRQALLRQAL
jgi:CheY-like chemotaxis protein